MASAGLLAVFAAPQAPPSSTPQSTPVIRSTSRLVQVSVVVLDKRGQSVSGLTRDDFELFENGKPQRIDVFAPFTRSSAAPPTPSTVSPGIFSNRGGPQARVAGTVSVLLLDGLNTRIEDQQNAKKQVVKFLEQLRPDDRVALYTLGSSLRVLHDFTRDTSSLLAALHKFRGRSSVELDPGLAYKPVGTPDDEAIGTWLSEAATRVENFMEQTRVLRTLDALEAIADHLAHLPGRKNLLWVSGGFPFSFGQDDLPSQNVLSAEKRQFFGEMERTARALNNANVVLYPVDARGLIGAFTDPNFNQAGAVTGRPRRTFGGGIEPVRPPIVSLSDTGPTLETMKELAERTGGRAFYNSNDIRKALHRAVDETRDTYELGFYPTHGKWDGSFRELRVRVLRSGLEVRHRKGYIAYAGLPETAEDHAASMNSAARNPLDATALGISVRLSPGRDGGSSARTFEITLDPKDLVFRQENGRWIGAVRVLLAKKNPEGLLGNWETHTINLRLTQFSYERAMREGLHLDGQFLFPPEVRELRVVVCDENSGSLGSLSVPLTEATNLTRGPGTAP
jgi:VWFA-related protein